MILSALLLLYLPAAAEADSQITLIRVYSTSNGTVFDVCKGLFDPPVTDAMNPAYCKGEVLNWTEQQWKAYNAGGRAGGKGSGKPKSTPTKAAPGVATGSAPGSEAMATPVIPYGGSLDPTAVLGIENPLCGEPKKLSAAQLRNCESSRSPEAAYPVGNYGWDIHVESGGFISSLFVPAVSFVLQLLSVIWLVLLMMLKGCLIILGFAFSLSPFTDNRMLSQIGTGLSSFFEHLTSPWMSTLFVILGGWGLYNGLVRRRTGETLAGMLMALVMLLGGLWIIHSPRDTVGRVAEAVNSASLTAVSAPSSGRVNAPMRSYNDAMAGVWNRMTAVPFCAMNFSDVQWCMTAKPSEEALDAARSGLDEDDPFIQQILTTNDPELATSLLAKDLTGLFGSAPTIRDLYLRFSPMSGSRDKLWEYYNGKPDNQVGLPMNIGPQLNVGGGSDGAAPDKVAMQGRSGVLTRMVMVFIFTIGLLGGLLLLLWLAMRIVMATASSFVLVLATPLAMFFPVFGQAGRSAFTKWLTALLGAIVAKLVYSGLLGIVLLGSSVIGSSIGRSSPTLGLIAVMAFWWAVFLSREKYLSLFQVDPTGDRGAAGLYRTLAGGYLGYRIARGAAGAVGTMRDERRDRRRHHQDEENHRRRRRAGDELDQQAHQRLDVATANAQSRELSRSSLDREVAELRADPGVRSLRENPSSLNDADRQAAIQKSARLDQLQEEQRAARPQAQADRRLLSRVRANEAAGLPAHGKAEIQGAREAIRREARLPIDAPEHRWRAEAAGKEPSSPEGRKAIGQSLAVTQSAVGAMSADRIEQVEVHRPRRSGGDHRQPTGRLRRRESQGPGVGDRSRMPDGPRPMRRSRARDWISR
ncbi:MAG TPA: hypothetical protein VFU11_06910 [Solirubrobacterales bacterium]|nr:hypothetical protein [Solirubrobacterales bacterium]